ncbi:MAG: MBL fold metallo-hydrolase [Clostridia bacterium]
MRIFNLVENVSLGDYKSAHGLSIYIETKTHKILFDLGPDKTIFENAKLAKIDLSEVDTVIISHGHYDHGGALEEFLKINNKAKIYLQKSAFKKHYSVSKKDKHSIGIDENLINHSQIILKTGAYKIDEELSLFTVKSTGKCRCSSNDSLYDDEGQDKFTHEQNLVINSDKKIMLMGCGHNGVVDIMEQSPQKDFSIVIGGFHLSSRTGVIADEKLLDDISKELAIYNATKFYTCHCTGEKAFDILKTKMNNIFYFHVGDEIVVK